MIRIKIADIPIGIENKYDYLVRHCEDYLTDEEPLFTVSVADSEIADEREHSTESFTDGYFESIVAYRKIAERLAYYDAFVFHGAVISHDGAAYAFTAKSGVGKTTHTRLWMSEFGENTHYINGDKPIIRFIDGVPYASGTPWRGKESYGRNEMARLDGIALLSRSEKNTASSVPPKLAVIKLITQIYMPKDEEAAKLTLKLADRLMSSVRLVELGCNMEAEAAHIALRALTDGK